jgi:hypothetical protein
MKELKELLAEKGLVYLEHTLLNVEDVKIQANYNGESHGELLRVLEEFYEANRVRIYEYQVDLFDKFLEEKENESNGLN